MSKIYGNTDFEYELAVRQGNVRRIRSLKKNKIKPPDRMLLFALIRRRPELLPILREAGANPNDENGFHETALGRAVNHYPLDVVKTLLDLGADPNKESLHLLPLVEVASDDKIEYARTLLKYGADPNHPQWNRVTPLYAALRDCQVLTIRLLVEARADPMMSGPDGSTLIDYAASLKRRDIIDLLKPFIKNKGVKSKIGKKARG